MQNLNKLIKKEIIVFFFAIVISMSSAIASDTDVVEVITEKTVQAVLIANQKAIFSSELTGKIISLDYDEGDTFKKGSVLFAIDCTSLQAILREKKADKDAAWAQYSASKQLKALKSTSELELTMALMEFRKAEALVDISEYKTKRCKLNAPFNGRVVERKVNLYETTNEGQEMISVISTDKLYVKMLVPSEWLRWLKVDTPLAVSVHEVQETYSAKIIRIGGAVDEVSQSIMVIAEISETPQNLLSGMSGLANFNAVEE